MRRLASVLGDRLVGMVAADQFEQLSRTGMARTGQAVDQVGMLVAREVTEHRLDDVGR